VHNGNNHPLPPQPPPQSARSSALPPTPQDRRLVVDRATPAPPIVVVSPDNSDQSSRNSTGYGSPERLSIGLEPGGSATPPRTSPLNRLRGPKDTIPIVAKPPRKQRSSRFVVTEKVEIERLAPFLGLSYPFSILSLSHRASETPPSERPQLFIKKLHQCHVLFDFNDASSELKGKQIKAQTLHEMLEYITTQRGVISESIYPEVVKMVRLQFSLSEPC
jgi:serine/threonine-protein phosphatase 2A regulatory subunit B'